MVTLHNLSDVFLAQSRLKRYIKNKYDLSWTEYLILATAYKMEETYGYVATADLIIEMELNRGSVYNAVNGLASKDYLDITRSKNPWLPNNLNLTFRGKVLLSSIERLVGESFKLETVLTYPSNVY